MSQPFGVAQTMVKLDCRRAKMVSPSCDDDLKNSHAWSKMYLIKSE